ncbi:hypothetical protein BJX68DRAFT_246044 [Aspergillus pseudodeflectus]|uniref:Uncharacterized protein n=1 Tax=Aspergillus pseudodeflectus TaxID=176178 RepID=A0ABR4JPW0_9EURO
MYPTSRTRGPRRQPADSVRHPRLHLHPHSHSLISSRRRLLLLLPKIPCVSARPSSSALVSLSSRPALRLPFCA